MEDEVNEDWWESQSLEDLERELITEGDKSATSYLRESWLSAMMAVLRDARRSAGLSQAALAEQLGTRQPSVSRLEHDENTTLSRFIDYLIACGRMPFEVETIAIDEMRNFLQANLEIPQSAHAVRRWKQARVFPQPIPAHFPAANIVVRSAAVTAAQDALQPLYGVGALLQDSIRQNSDVYAGLVGGFSTAIREATSSFSAAIQGAMNPFTYVFESALNSPSPNVISEVGKSHRVFQSRPHVTMQNSTRSMPVIRTQSIQSAPDRRLQFEPSWRQYPDNAGIIRAGSTRGRTRMAA